MGVVEYEISKHGVQHCPTSHFTVVVELDDEHLVDGSRRIVSSYQKL